jgi:membrane protein implicated in regulation of membrane protease activity
MDRDTRNALVGAAWFLAIFAIAAYYLPTIMLAVGDYSAAAGGLVGIAFVAAFFVVLWLRGRSQSRKGKGK